MAGLVVIDFIDMEQNSHVRKVEKAMKDALKNDRARIQVGRISSFGLMEMSRQRLRTGVLEASTKPCPHCDGTGLMRTASSAGLSALRIIEDEATRGRGDQIMLRAGREAAVYVLNKKRAELADIEQRYGVPIEVVIDETFEGARMTVESSGPRPVAGPRHANRVSRSTKRRRRKRSRTKRTRRTRTRQKAEERARAREREGDRQGRKRRRRRRGGRGRTARIRRRVGTRRTTAEPSEDMRRAERPSQPTRPRRSPPSAAAVAVDAKPAMPRSRRSGGARKPPIVERPIAEEPPIAGPRRPRNRSPSRDAQEGGRAGGVFDRRRRTAAAEAPRQAAGEAAPSLPKRRPKAAAGPSRPLQLPLRAAASDDATASRDAASRAQWLVAAHLRLADDTDPFMSGSGARC